MLVMKFGGTSVGDARCIGHVAGLVAETLRTERELVVVVSAMAGVTNALFAAARTACCDRGGAQACLDGLLARHQQVASALLMTHQEQDQAASNGQGV